MVSLRIPVSHFVSCSIIWIFVNLVFSQCLKSFSEPSLQELVDSRIALKTANMTATLVILPSGNSTLITPRKCQVFGETGVVR